MPTQKKELSVQISSLDRVKKVLKYMYTYSIIVCMSRNLEHPKGHRLEFYYG